MSATTVAPSPQKSTSLKRPQTDGTTPQDLSSVKSPDQSFKKARLNGDDSNGVKDIGKGGRWMVEKLEELERLYKAVVKAATIILQYQAFAVRLGKDAQKLPVHLRRRINIAWGSYEASRRQVQTYMNESAQQATTPSSRQFAIPMPLPPPNASLSVPVIGTSNLPLASPIPLSAATMLSFDHPASGNVEQQQATQPASATADTKPFSFDMLQNSNQVGNDNSNGMFDIQGMNLGGPNGMSEFAAMLQQGSQDFTLDGLLGNVNAQPPAPSGQAQTQQQPITPQETPTQNALPAENPSGNDDTDQILAQLGAFAVQDGQAPDVGAIPDQTSAGMGDDDINALLASLGDTDGQDFTNFDFGSNLDMGNLGEMAGLFNTTTTVDSDLKPDVPPEAPVKVEGATAVDTQAAVINNNASATGPKQEEQVAQPAPVSDNNDFTAIDLDDFNFGDGDEAQEGMGMSGDEFDRLLAGAFND